MLYFVSVRSLCGVTLAVLALAAPAVSQAQSGYTITDLGTLGGPHSVGNGINASGQVTGESDTTGRVAVHAFLAESAGIHDLGTLGGKDSVGHGINDGGQVTGWADTSSPSRFHAARWTGATVEDLNLPGSGESMGWGINSSGQVAGYADPTGGAGAQACSTLDRNYSLNCFPTLGGGSSDAYSINDSGQVTGSAYLSRQYLRSCRALDRNEPPPISVRWEEVVSEGYAINASGQIAGYSLVSGSIYGHAARWTGTTPTDLGTLGGVYSKAFGINTSGQVVGQAYTASGGEDAFYTVGDTMYDLNTLLPAHSGWLLTGAAAINDNGQITGLGVINGQDHAFLLTPNAVPEPSALALFSVGAFVARADLRRRRRK